MKTFLLCLLATSNHVRALHRRPGIEIGPIDAGTEKLSKRSLNFNGWGTFDQLIDHADPDLGTFPQRYWYGTEFWKGPGSPIILMTPGEVPATNLNKTYTTTDRLPGLFASETGGAVIILEHRYWGQSSPFASLTSEKLQYLTTENARKDLTYFANNFKPPFDESGMSSPVQAPWILSGGSYAGALAAWTASLDPGTFWAYHVTSGVVQAVGDYWQYFSAAQKAMPQNCSADVQKVIGHVDQVLYKGRGEDKLRLKEKFMLSGLSDADFAYALSSGPRMWQSTQFYTSTLLKSNPFYDFCDHIENVELNSGPVPGAEGIGLPRALNGYAKWFTEQYLPGFCESTDYPSYRGRNNTRCFALTDPTNPIYHDIAAANVADRQWQWMLCNEPFEYWQTAPPPSHPTLISRLLTPNYFRAQCALYFPSTPTTAVARGQRAPDLNARTGGWAAAPHTPRVMFTNGELDPWLGATVSAPGRPGGPLAGSEETPVRVIPGGMHCSDLYRQNWAGNEGVRRVVEAEVRDVKRWVGEFYGERRRRRRGLGGWRGKWV
ncbi:serine-type peptidase-like protein [Lasiosphaeria hispida]|uniref:Serine-type peptidase-like protein n=1 Tax=Lasiosphaeria hispida TaxID=260671 RepID=A0AAJ0HFA0_9PEZI|nr:serine-type peptidase-like protein [Lasiosphaeria hispida]